MIAALHSPFIIPLGAFAMVSIIVWVNSIQKTRERELQHDLQVKEMEHEARMKQLEIERLRLSAPSDTPRD
jgi:uncharacterized protein (UPF0261 family)